MCLLVENDSAAQTTKSMPNRRQIKLECLGNFRIVCEANGADVERPKFYRSAAVHEAQTTVFMARRQYLY